MAHQDDTTDPDKLRMELQQEIDAWERALYSAKVITEARSPKHIGRMPQADVRGLVHGWCGDTMEIYLRLKEEQIVETTFMTDGCGPTLACGSMLTSLIQGKSLAEASTIMPEDLIAALDGLPSESQHCAELAVRTLQNAILNWRMRDEIASQKNAESRVREHVAARAGDMLRQGYH
jgi:nitrogen fixation NifU-like protein